MKREGNAGVTVAIPSVPPRASLLQRAVASVLNQTHKAAGISIAVDIEREGEAPTRNRALAGVTTEWVAFLDDDDELYPHHLSSLLMHQETTNADLVYCVDEETEIFTADGWRRYDHLAPGVEVLTLNHSTGLAEWQSLEQVHVFPARPREMLLMQSRDHSSLTTLSHRWPVEIQRFSGGKRLGYLSRGWTQSSDLTTAHAVPVASDIADLPIEQKWSDAFVELVAWFWTEGSIAKSRSRASRAVSICQATKSADNCERIRSVLRRVFGPPVERMPRSGSRTDGLPRWRESSYGGAGRNTTWHLSVDAGQALLEVAPDRVPTPNFLRSLTRSQLALFIEVSLLADNNGFRALAQKDRRQAEAFQFAVTLAGFASSLRYHTHKPTPMWQVRIRTRKRLIPANTHSSRITHVGPVWCPQTENGTWLARRRGTVYYTGNSWFDVQGGTDPLGRFGMEFDGEALKANNFIPVTYLVRTELIKHVGGFPLPRGGYPSQTACVDWAALLAMLEAGGKFVHLPERTWLWHHHAKNTSGRPWKQVYP